MKRFLLWIGIGIWTLFGFFGALVFFDLFGAIPLNNWGAHKVGVWLAAVELPPDSHLLRRETSVANFAPAGNQCDYATGEIRTTSLSKKQLESFYAKRINESNAMTGQASMRTFEIFFPDDEDSYQYLDDTFANLMREYAHASSTGTIYLALAVDGPHEPGLDFRCH